MTTELTLLAWTLVLTIVQIMLTASARTQETGLAYNASPRDEPGPPVRRLTGRLQRAQANLYETLPLFAAAILIAHVGGREGSLTLVGAWLYLVARIAYVPLYTFGITYARTLAWLASLVAVILVIVAVLAPK